MTANEKLNLELENNSNSSTLTPVLLNMKQVKNPILVRYSKNGNRRLITYLINRAPLPVLRTTKSNKTRRRIAKPTNNHKYPTETRSKPLSLLEIPKKDSLKGLALML